jgi:hypothetical protein
VAYALDSVYRNLLEDIDRAINAEAPTVVRRGARLASQVPPESL